MAELKPGVIGTISGKIDNVIASNWRDIRYLRGIAKTSKKEATEAQTLQRTKFGLLFDFLSTMARVADLGFKYQYTGRSTAFNLAMSRNMPMVKGDLASLTIDYPSVILSKGRLPYSPDAQADSKAPGTVSVTWGSLDSVIEQELSDRVIVAIYNPVKKQAVYSLNGAVRSELKIDVQVPASYTGSDVHVWVFFTSDKVKKNSATVYAGMVTVF